MSSSVKTRNLVHNASLLSKFKGALVGAVVGDCLGAPFEMSFHVKVDAVKNFFKKLEKRQDDESGCHSFLLCHLPSETKNDESSTFQFTDDTAMTRSVAASLIHNKELNSRDMAKRFVDEYYIEKWRGYGGNVVTVFNALRNDNCAEPHGPAAKQFDGQGSYGNGAAMRISPAALFAYLRDQKYLDNLVENISKITHSHQDAIIGAQLECAAVHTALHQKASLDRQNFIDHLINWIDRLEPDADRDSDSPPKAKKRAKRSDEVPRPYCHKLKLIKDHLTSGDTQTRQIEAVLGNDISALGSVPAAIFSFLLCNSPIASFETDNAFERTIMYAISLGGDTDTIATMAGAIAGAYYGVESIPSHWINYCEATDDAIKMAQSLYIITMDTDDQEESSSNAADNP